MFRSSRSRVILVLSTFAIVLLAWTGNPKKHVPSPYHLRGGTLDSLFEGSNSLFSSAGTCDHCHGSDPSGLASTDIFGNDVNVVDAWSASIMANSARDPFWLAKVSHEVFVNPHLQQEIESTCVRCHAPLGIFDALHNGENHYSMEHLHNDPVALDGVSCLACHQQLPISGEAQHSGKLLFSSLPVAYGPYESPLVTPMALYSGVVPEHGPHINEAALCAGCHSLITQTIDLNGNPTGGDFVEQATWHEWLNSSYPGSGTTCQSCHLPRLYKQGIVLAAGYNTPAREPFGLHTLAGGNAFMLSIMRDNREALGISAPESLFDSSIQTTLDNLQQNSLALEASLIQRTADSVFLKVNLRNLTGHKLPSGYPARKMSVHVTMRKANGDELFRSGGFTESFYIPGESTPFEPHHQVIRNPDQVQIYEMIMGDVNGNKTTVLERGAMHLKDNRLVPLGFSTTHPQYDSTAIYLTGASDPDFNFNLAQGSGTDDVYYHMSTEGYEGAVSVSVEVYYQSLPPTWMEEIFTVSTPEIDTWQSMFNAADQNPILMRSASIEVPGISATTEVSGFSFAASGVKNNLLVRVPNSGEINTYDLSGRLISTFMVTPGEHLFPVSTRNNIIMVVYKSTGAQPKVSKVFIRGGT